MLVTIDMEKLQAVIYYCNHVQIPRAQRDRIHRAMLEGILHGEIDTDCIFVPEQQPIMNVQTFLKAYVDAGGNEGWIQASELYEAYTEWCLTVEEDAESLTCFGTAMQALGVRKKKRARANFYYLKPDRGGNTDDLI